MSYVTDEIECPFVFSLPRFVFCPFSPFVTRAIVSRLTAARALRALYRVTGRAAPAWSHTFLGISFHFLIAFDVIVLCVRGGFSSRCGQSSFERHRVQFSVAVRDSAAPRCAPVL